jgi:hypothetical protein
MLENDIAKQVARSLVPDLRTSIIDSLMDESNDLIERLRERIRDDLIAEQQLDDIVTDRDEMLAKLYQEEFETARERVKRITDASVQRIEEFYNSVLISRAKEIEIRLLERLSESIERTLVQRMEKRVLLWTENEMPRIFDKEFERRLQRLVVDALTRGEDESA